MENKWYFGYYRMNGAVCSMKWVGNEPIGGQPHTPIQKHPLTEREVELGLTALAFIYPFKELPELQ